MKKHSKISLMLLVTVVLLLAMAVPGMAEKDTNFYLTYDFINVDWDTNYAVGSFEMTEPYVIDDATATIHWIPRTGAKQGSMFFSDPDTGDFVIRFIHAKYLGDYCWSGHFHVVTFRGTGDFENMRGDGYYENCRPDMGSDVNGYLEGWVEFAE